MPSARHAGGWQKPEEHTLVPQQGLEPTTPLQAPPSAMHVGPPLVSAQKKPVSNGRQVSPVQQDVSLAPVHWAPSALQTGAGCAQRRMPAASGTHGVPPQHWSRNWQTAPAAMQHCGFAPS